MNDTMRTMLAISLALTIGCGQETTKPDSSDDVQATTPQDVADDDADDDGDDPVDSTDPDDPSDPDHPDDPDDPNDPDDPTDPIKPDEPEYLGEWYRSMGAAGPEIANAVAVDDDGNVYVAGTFDREMTVGGQTITAVPGDYEPRPDVFVASFDSSGEFRWIQSFGSKENEKPASIVLDGDGNVYVIGDNQEQLQFGDTAVEFLGQSDLYIVSYDSDGTFRWAESFGGPYSETPTAAAINDAGQIVITGSYQGLFTAGNHTLSSMDEWAAMDVFTMRFDTTTRTVDWVTGFSGFLIDTGTAVGIADDGSAVVGVSLQYDLLIDAQTTWEVGEAFGAGIVALDETGTVMWSELLQGDGAREVTDLAVTPDGSVHATGVFEEQITLAGTTLDNSSSRAHDTWVARFDTSGALVWARGFGDNGFDQPLGLGHGRYGVYVTGRFDDDIAFDEHELTAADGYDVFVVSLAAPDGAVRWARAIGGEGDDQPNALSVDAGRGVYVSGYASGALMFNEEPQPAAGELVDAFVLRLEDP